MLVQKLKADLIELYKEEYLISIGSLRLIQIANLLLF